jgi:hypothetical protein
MPEPPTYVCSDLLFSIARTAHGECRRGLGAYMIVAAEKEPPMQHAHTSLPLDHWLLTSFTVRPYLLTHPQFPTRL